MLSVLPSSTVADWAATFTVEPPAENGVPGDEWFDRQHQHFYEPVPISVTDTADFTLMLNDDLVGKQLEAPMLYERLKHRSYVSMLRVPPTTFAGMVVAPDGRQAERKTALESISTTSFVGAATNGL